MEINQDWEIKLIEEARVITQHGFGKLEFRAVENRDVKTKVIIWAGRSFVFFVKKVIDLDRKKVI